jgi:hypothetical protein
MGDVMKYTLGQVKKAVVGGVGFLLVVIQVADPLNLIPAQFQPWAALVTGAAATYGIYAAQNDKVVAAEKPRRRRRRPKVEVVKGTTEDI